MIQAVEPLLDRATESLRWLDWIWKGAQAAEEEVVVVRLGGVVVENGFGGLAGGDFVETFGRDVLEGRAGGFGVDVVDQCGLVGRPGLVVGGFGEEARDAVAGEDFLFLGGEGGQAVQRADGVRRMVGGGG